jgi:hypothetical protein
MSDDEKKPAEPQFLSRWSRLKQEAREQPPATQPVIDVEAPVPALPPVDELTMESDFSGFFHPKVDENLRRAALKKLFSDPHFNIMDGLDTYIDDYSQPNPLPAAMLAGLRQAQNILAWAKETKEETAARFAPPPVDHAAASTADQVAVQTGDSVQPPAVEQAANVAPTAAKPPADVVAATAGERKS